LFGEVAIAGGRPGDYLARVASVRIRRGSSRPQDWDIVGRGMGDVTEIVEFRRSARKGLGSIISC